MKPTSGGCPLIGTWRLRSWSAPPGAAPTNASSEWRSTGGQLMYTPDWSMSVHLANADRAAFTSATPYVGTDAEKLQAFDGYHAYCGTFRWEGDRVVHVVEHSLYPNYVGRELVRRVAFDGPNLVLTAVDGGGALHWEPASPPA